MLGAIGIAAGLVIVNAHVLTLDANAPHATCLVAKGERIVTVGMTAADCLHYRAEAASRSEDEAPSGSAAPGGAKDEPKDRVEAMPVIDAGGATIVPGFNDAHVHLGLSMLFEHLIRLPAYAKAAHKAAWLQLLRSKVAKAPGTGWIFVQTPELPLGLESGHELDMATLPPGTRLQRNGKHSPVGGQPPRAGQVSPVGGQLPRAGQVSPVGGRPPRAGQVSPVGGQLPRRGQHSPVGGRPLLVVTRHGGLLSSEGLRQAPPGFALPDGFVPGRKLAPFLQVLAQRIPWAEQRAAALAFLATARALGITSAQFMSEDFSRLFESLRKAGELTLRARFVPLPTVAPPELTPFPLWVRSEGVKYYHDDPAPISRRDLSHIVAKAMAQRSRAVFHVLGRYALAKLLDVVERLTKSLGPPVAGTPSLASYLRLDHADQLGPAEAARLAKLGMMVCINPPLIAEWSSAELGPAATLAAAGVGLCIGTDWVGRTIPRPLSPLENLKLATLHGGVGESQRLPIGQALYAYTAGSAAAEGLAAQKGKLYPGMLADFVLLDRDPTAVAPYDLPKIQVLTTVVGGRVVYRAPR